MNNSPTHKENETWEARIRASHEKRIHKNNVVDDGFFSHMAKGADFEGVFEIPAVKGVSKVNLPKALIPFSLLGRSKNYEEGVCFFEKDPLFADAVVAADDFIDELRRFPLVLSPDCSLYRDMPLATQIANTYLSRLVGHHFENCGLTMVPTVRWGDERSYTSELFEEPFAFTGIPKKCVVAIGTYGCIRGAENQRYFREGLEAMLDYLTPTMVLVYGSMPDAVFGDVKTVTQFVHYPDWTSFRHGRS